MSSGKIINNIQFRMNYESDLNVDYTPIINGLIEDPLALGINRNNLENILYSIMEIHLLLKNNSDLSNKQKLDYCKIERALMIQYLKEIVKKY